MAVARIKMMYAVLFALPGIPLLYAGDERAVLNDYTYRTDEKRKNDSRWVNRIKTDWNNPCSFDSQKEIADAVKKLIAFRKNEPALDGAAVEFYDVQDSHVFAFRRTVLHVIANFSETPAVFFVNARSDECTDVLTGRQFAAKAGQHLGAYEVRWLKEL